MTYISAQEAADQWNISKRRVQTLCSTQRIPNAVRIGNMWVVPENAQKPSDARKKITATTKVTANPIRAARKTLRAISVEAFHTAQKEIVSVSAAKKSVMVLYTAELLHQAVSMKTDMADAVISRIYDMFGICPQLSSTTALQISGPFKSFLIQHRFCIDDALSWAYQFVNKSSQDSGLESTQFFTEKYMIAALVDQCNIERGIGKILDPACGGGNFLLYALDYLCDADRIPQSAVLPEYVAMQLDRLYGYELDSTLAILASVNLRVKAISILKEHGIAGTFEDFFSCAPNIYYSVEDNIKGALDMKASTHSVICVGTAKTDSLASVLGSAEFIFTNPPFQTVKGMEEDKKTFLKSDFPEVKCDMCNAFFEHVLYLLADKGVCGLVTQNSWMYLDSFEQLRMSVLRKYSIQSIIELGSNAFYDISGEKANVVLVVARKSRPTNDTSIAMYPLQHLPQADMETVLSTKNGIRANRILLNQSDLLQSAGARFGMLGANSIKLSQDKCTPYGEYATPMQGTSTGDAKSLVGYFWEHIGDYDWKPVSKGGGFSRWAGLNSYSVKWGKNGEYIESTRGSAIRNAKYFDDTQLVFSDTGTAGLNVRLLRKGQIFIASGPGIRIAHGKPLAHIAFLNSRFSSYFMRLLSPKLTIAAGYIAKIPTFKELLSSDSLEENARICIALKNKRLSMGPINLEFEPLVDVGYTTTIAEQSSHWFISDIESEWAQLCAEKEIDNEVLTAFRLSNSDRENIDALVGCHAFDIPEGYPILISELDRSISGVLSVNCTLNRTKPSKNHLGCDGVLEYMAHKISTSPQQIYRSVLQDIQGFPETLRKYRDAYIHNIVLSTLGYSVHSLPDHLPKKMKKVMEDIAIRYPNLSSELPEIESWIIENLTSFHQAAFLNTPIIQYSAVHNTVESARR